MFDWNPVHWAESGASAVGHAFNDARKFVQDHWVEIAVVVAAVGVAACVATVACATAAIGMLGELSPTAAGWLLGAGGAAVATEEGIDAASGGSGDIVKYEPYPPDDGFLGESVEDTLEPGTRISRYGGPGGQYASPEGTPFGERGMNPAAASNPYNVYEVMKPVTVQGGIAQYWMGGGGGAQYLFSQPIQNLLDQGVLKQVGP